MYCNKIKYRNFRNIADEEIEFENGVNILCGNNAEGKTNSLEGIYLFANGRSFRKCTDRDMISFDSDFSSLKLDFTDRVRQQEMELKLQRGQRKTCRRNSVPIKKMSDFLGYFRAVLFCPEHLSIIKDGPSERRSFLDSAISQIKPYYAAALAKYSNILDQRNDLLKNYEEKKDEFDKTIALWSGFLAKEAELISRERLDYVKKLDQHIADFFNDMTSGNEKVAADYPYIKSEEDFYRDLTQNLEKEIASGTTLYGPHKDDIDITLNGRDSRLYCSQGQQRCLSLALKMAEGEISKEVTGEYPVFLFDDVFSELDSKRKNYVINGIKDRQVIITSCEKDELEKNAQCVFEVSKGKYTRIK